MPWKSASVEDERARFVAARQADTVTMLTLCRSFGISTKTGYKWLGRHASTGQEGLRDRSRAPHTSPQTVGLTMEQWILRARDLYPHWGPKKLIIWVRRESGLSRVCVASTAGEILRQHGLTRRQQATRKAEPFAGALVEGVQPNDLWCIDFKGHFRTQDGQRCDALTLTDGATRFLLRCQALPGMGQAGVRRVLESAFREYGLPARIRSDNGSPFGSLGLGGHSALSLWWIKLGIAPERIAPGQPYQNGRHERMHRTLKQETASPPAATGRAQQRRFEAFRQEFNEVRPHEALGQRTPGSLYTVSPRRYLGAARAEPTYPAGWPVRKVQSNGMIYWAGQRLFLGEAYAGEQVGLAPKAKGTWTVHFGPMPIGLVDEAERVIRPLKKRRRKRKKARAS